MIGAGLALTWGRRIGRWPLAIVCGVCGFAFTVVQDCGDWVTYSDHSLTQLGLYVGRGLAYDAVHAIGCVAFALAFGPALIRSLQRFSRRLQVTWSEPAPASGPVARGPGARHRRCSCSGSRPASPSAWLGHRRRLGAPARAAAGSRPRTGHAAALSPTAAIARARAYLIAAENRDGGFGPAAGQPSAALFTGWAALGLAATGRSPLTAGHRRSQRDRCDPRRAGRWRRRCAGANDPRPRERPARLRAASAVAISSPRLRARRRADGSIAGQVNLTAFAILALRSAGAGVTGRSYALAARAAEPRWRLRVRRRGAERRRRHRRGARGSLRRRRPPARRAAGRSPTCARPRTATAGSRPRRGRAPTPSRPHGRSRGCSPPGPRRRRCIAPERPSPDAYLLSLLAPDGSIRYARGQSQTPVWVTGEALMALAGRPLPIAPVTAPAIPVSAGSTSRRRPPRRPAGSPHRGAVRSSPDGALVSGRARASDRAPASR